MGGRRALVFVLLASTCTACAAPIASSPPAPPPTVNAKRQTVDDEGARVAWIAGGIVIGLVGVGISAAAR